MDWQSPLWNSVRVDRPPSILVELGNRIRAKRKEARLTQEELAHESEIDRSYIGSVERGRRNLTFLMLCRIAKALHCDVADLVQGLPGNR